MARVLRKHREWAAIGGELCRVRKFTPLAWVVSGEVFAKDRTTPYALVELETPKLPPGTIGAITHRDDFRRLWALFVERTPRADEEVIVAWNTGHLKGLAKLLSPFVGHLDVMLCRAGAYELLTDPTCQPELTGEARWLAERPIVHLSAQFS